MPHVDQMYSEVEGLMNHLGVNHLPPKCAAGLILPNVKGSRTLEIIDVHHRILLFNWLPDLGPVANSTRGLAELAYAGRAATPSQATLSSTHASACRGIPLSP